MRSSNLFGTTLEKRNSHAPTKTSTDPRWSMQVDSERDFGVDIDSERDFGMGPDSERDWDDNQVIAKSKSDLGKRNSPAPKKTPTEPRWSLQVDSERDFGVDPDSERDWDDDFEDIPVKSYFIPELSPQTRNAIKTLPVNMSQLSDRPMPQPSAKSSTRKSASAKASPGQKVLAFKEKIKRANATRKIGRFMKKTQHKRRAHFLKSICSDSNVCIAFGTETNKIKKHFNDFKDFALLSVPGKTMGQSSSNGFIKLLTYEHEGYKANAILKSSVSDRADNLLYEAMVGKFLNKKGKQFPCFLETYGIFKYKSHQYVEKMRFLYNTPIDVFQNGMEIVPETQVESFILRACTYPTRTSVLIQNIQDAVPLSEMITEYNFNVYELLYVLYQVYMPLTMLWNDFTHYDLHENNVLLYEPVQNHYIQYHYHMTGSLKGVRPYIVSFKSRYIAKIIDYGRCYFNDRKNPDFTGSSEKLYEKICEKCKECGIYSGFSRLRKMSSDRELAERSYISAYQKNVSHDLRLLYRIKNVLLSNYSNARLPKIGHSLKKVSYGNGIRLSFEFEHMLQRNPYESVYYGTKEILMQGLPTKINNIIDAYEEFETLIQDRMSIDNNEKTYAGMQKLGDLHIYQDGRPMQYIPAK